MPRLKSALLILGVLIVLSIAALFLPLNYDPPGTPAPAPSFAHALARIEEIEAVEAALPLYAGCETQFLSHGEPTEQVALLLHGYGNCPLQFSAFAEALHARGYNVYVPRAPHMGWEPAFSAEQAKLTADELARYAQVSADIAQGLGEEVTVVGFSVGGVLGGWHAQRRELAQVLLISPAFDLPEVPDPLFAPVVRLAAVLPNLFLQPDSGADDPEYVYPRNGTRPVSAFLLMASAVRDAAQEAAPATHAITVVTNANDETVAHDDIRELVVRWREQGAHVSAYEFPQDLELGHDLIDPRQPDERTDLVYPVLFRLLQVDP